MGNNSSYSIWVKLDRYPPVLVRLLAVSPLNHRLLMHDEIIVRRSKGALSLGDVKQLSYAPSWHGVAVDKMKSFCLACNVDFADRARMRTLNRTLRSGAWVGTVRRDHNFPEYRVMLEQLLNHESNRSRTAG